ncbi:ABC transporter permease [Agrobacterium tumefaciens]|uniref:ABC transporter permease n=1 Tax=Agrobacterium tumefaciens TaxID=358 RepID=UPI00224334E0|nr:ABC transporter permease [Agrobacterium tumefaciens]MCW8143077.1 ABC transporter permease [Agrobacterium tumefaciens]
MKLTVTQNGALASHDLKPKRANRSLRPSAIWLVIPGVAFLATAFVLPLVILLSQSVYDEGFTLRYFEMIFTTPSYLTVIWITLKTAVLASAATMLLAYPVSCYLMVAKPATRSIMMALIIIPFWTNILVRCYAWMAILQRRGLVNTFLTDQVGVIDRPIDMVYNLSGVLIGMTHYLLPPAILILYSINHNIDLRLVGAARSLGANSSRAFRHVFLPLSMPGVRAATLLVMILSLGFFVIPALLGGLSDTTLATLINVQFTESVDWHFGAALSMVLLVMTLIGIGVYYQALSKTTGGKQP